MKKQLITYFSLFQNERVATLYRAEEREIYTSAVVIGILCSPFIVVYFVLKLITWPLRSSLNKEFKKKEYD